MNENIDLTKILEGCPKGTKLYSTFHGEVSFEAIDVCDAPYPIALKSFNKLLSKTINVYFTKEGNYTDEYDGECILFPSKDQRDWSKFERFWDKPKPKIEKFKFDPKTLQPFDKVLVRDYSNEHWRVDIFGFMIDEITCCTTNWRCCIPYNEETKHLIGTIDDCPEYYKWWEE